MTQPRQHEYRIIMPLPLTENAARVLDVRDPNTGELIWPIDPVLLDWLQREGADKRALDDAMEVVEFHALGVMPPELVDPRAIAQLEEAGAPRDELEWYGFRVVLQRPAWSVWGEAAAGYWAGQDALEVGAQLEGGPDAQSG